MAPPKRKGSRGGGSGSGGGGGEGASAASAAAGGPGKPVPVKLVLVGQSNVGKSSIAEWYVHNQFKELESTIGAAFMRKELQVSPDFCLRYEIWDTAGQEPAGCDGCALRFPRFRSLAPMYYRGAQAAIIVYDCTSTDSYNAAKGWVKELERQLHTGIVMALCGNKTDLGNLREVPSKDAQAYAKESGMLFFETSAKKGTNVNEMFLAIGRELERQLQGRANETQRGGSYISVTEGTDLTSEPNGDGGARKCCA